jgi:hypothetical protein
MVVRRRRGDKDKAKSDTPKDPKDFNKEWWKDKECYRCGKKGHPASTCWVKPPSDNGNKSSRSSKSSSKVTTEIKKSMKTMGKAMTPLGKGADFDNDLFEEQLHAQLGTFRLGGQIKFGTIYIHTQLNTTAYAGITTKNNPKQAKKRLS